MQKKLELGFILQKKTFEIIVNQIGISFPIIIIIF